MRDLGQYLPSFKKEKYLRGRSGYNTESESVTIEAIERAIKAEAEVERLQKVYSITNESWQKIQAENALLRKVEEVGEILWSEAICHRCEARECRGCSAHDFKKAMSEYQSWKEGQK
jgi:hypothetical protein